MLWIKPEVREHWKSTVPNKEFWIAVLAVTIPLCIFGFYTIETGHVPEVPRGVNIALLVLLAFAVAYQMFKFGHRSFRLSQVVHLLGYALFLLSLTMAEDALGRSVLNGVGSVVIGGGILAHIFQFGKRKDASDPGPQNG